MCVIFHSNYYTTHNEHVIRFFVGCAALGTLGAAKHRHRTHGKKYCLLSINHLSWQDLIIRHAILFLLLFDPRFGCFWGRSKKKHLLWCVPFDRLIAIALHAVRCDWYIRWTVRFAKTHQRHTMFQSIVWQPQVKWTVVYIYIIRAVPDTLLLSTKLEWTQESRYNNNNVRQKCV